MRRAEFFLWPFLQAVIFEIDPYLKVAVLNCGWICLPWIVLHNWIEEKWLGKVTLTAE